MKGRIDEAKRQLRDIAELGDNWNDNGAKPFAKSHIEKCGKILDLLSAGPVIVAPTASGSIQIEFESDNGEYLEIEVFPHNIRAYSENI